MINEILTQNEVTVNFHKALPVPLGETVPAILIIRAFDRKGDWQLEVIFEGGAKAVTSATAEEVSAIESDLSDRGWQIEPSLWSNGFSAKPPIEDDCGMIFASSAGLWSDDLGLAEPTL